MQFNTALFRGDYIEASFQHLVKTYRQQYHIPNGLIEQLYSYDFFLEVGRSVVPRLAGRCGGCVQSQPPG